MDNELLLFDRVNVIKDTIQKYGEENFYLSFSGGKDSTILHYLLDIALPGNQIPRVFLDTGIEYQMIKNFVTAIAQNDSRFVLIKPTIAVKPMLEKYGYPFKSKEHCAKYNQWKKGNRSSKSIKAYLTKEHFGCPKMLRYQFTEEFNLNISNECCHQLKKNPAKQWAKENHKSITITGMRSGEWGERASIKNCILTNKSGKIVKFHPLIKVNEEWENWFVEQQESLYGKHILCELYYPPFNFKRTGCKGCPYSYDLQSQLDIMEKLLPKEKAQCEFIWKPVYEEYRRINYRLKSIKQLDLFGDTYDNK